MAKPKLSDDGCTVTVRVPISIRKRGGRKLVLAPDGTSCSRCRAISCESAEVSRLKNDSKSAAYEFRTKWAQSGGLETNRLRERISGPDGNTAVRSFVRDARSYWALLRARKPRRILVREGLAEGEELSSNGLR
jgi:hypothetical protein